MKKIDDIRVLKTVFGGTETKDNQEEMDFKKMTHASLLISKNILKNVLFQLSIYYIEQKVFESAHRTFNSLPNQNQTIIAILGSILWIYTSFDTYTERLHGRLMPPAQ
jgi:hypothetical protein